MTERVLVLNCGSSSVKYRLIEPVAGEVPARGLVERIGSDAARLQHTTTTDGTETRHEVPGPFGDHAAALDGVLRAFADHGPRLDTAGLVAVGHRVVHGGTRFSGPVTVDDEVLAAIEELAVMAPLHNPANLEGIRTARKVFPDLPHVAVFDTAFHATLPEDAYRYPVPEQWYREWGVRRYGFHGMSVAWSAERAAALLARPVGELRTVVAHLGSGCSVTAVDGGRSVATSMGLTPLEGLMMGTRAGSIDPGTMFYLLRTGRLNADRLEDQMEHQSGLLGVSGRTSDVRELVRMEAAGDELATLALQIFVRRAAECIAAAATSLPTVDAIVFTGGIGENAPGLRARIVARLGSIGVAEIPEQAVVEDSVLSAETAPAARAGATGSSPAVLRIEAREDLIVAREAARVVGARA